MLSILSDLSTNWISLIILLTVIGIVWIFDRKNFKREGIMFLRRTDKGLKFIDNFAKKHTSALKTFGTFGIIFAFGALGAGYVYKTEKKKNPVAKTLTVLAVLLIIVYLMNFRTVYALSGALLGASGFVVFQLVEGVVNIFLEPGAASQMQFVLPIQTTSAPVFYVPIDYWLISIFVLLIVHEFSHAFVSRAEGIKVNSLGYGFMAVIPLGFAEPDEKQLKKTESIKKSRIFSAGSFSNIIAAIISVILLTGTVFAVTVMYTTDGVRYGTVVSGSPAQAHLPHNGTINEINGKKIRGTNELAAVMDNVSEGSEISILVDGKVYSLKTAADPKNSTRAFMGISNLENVIVAKENYSGFASSALASVLLYFLSLFKWLFLLNLGIGLFNLLPIKPLDGGLIFEEIIKCHWPKSWKSIYSAVATTTFGLILFNLFGVYFVRTIFSVV
ncbi:MAG: site-2 protease family protein [Nanoarchaeota archaeon]|nr:site-2 protease family protein [Nanoarchaeota archaeon]MBU4300610.1 site-2 protease family protein [Nanoarchaeota archaeon]MBU4452163.1 site-2 protease family protein [Nanoarchaeota archaeon]MCG2724203.1 site-2 protease family protein [archaeon]